MDNLKICIIFDIDETMVQYLHSAVTINKWRSYNQDKIEAQEKDGSILLFRPGLREFITFAKTHNIDIAIWTYGNRTYSQFIEGEITRYAGLDKSPFVFVYSSEEIKEDLANGRGEKDLRRVYAAYPAKYTSSNTFLVDNRAANVFHEANRENGIIVESFDITAGYKKDKDNMFENLKRICGKIRTQTPSVLSSIFSESNVLKIGISQFYKKYIVKGTPLSLVSDGTIDKDSDFYPARTRRPPTTRRTGKSGGGKKRATRRT
jgi:HAD superfamily phosphatase (TIGR01681 family)